MSTMNFPVAEEVQAGSNQHQEWLEEVCHCIDERMRSGEAAYISASELQEQLHQRIDLLFARCE